jgi:hypothetical protein
MNNKTDKNLPPCEKVINENNNTNSILENNASISNRAQ